MDTDAIFVTDPLGPDLNRIAEAVEAIQRLLECAALLRPPADYSVDDSIPPGFE